jgi:polysaccharide deacetylase 2 family uncharacterized protein YibQ
MKTVKDATEAFKTVNKFIGSRQLKAMADGIRSEESQYFLDKTCEMAEIIKNMPKSYETEGQGKEAIAILHYFTGSWDWYITEKDKEEEQLQSFGLVSGFEKEYGYISIKEIIRANAELDLHWTTKKLKDI